MDTTHHQRILDQFTRQAEPFAQAPGIRSREGLERIVRMAEAGADDTVLDVACGPGLLTCAFARVVRHAVGLDITPAMLDQARKSQAEQGLANITWQSGDVFSLPFPDRHFSIVVSRFVLHHLLDPLAAVKEMKRVCQENGRVVIADIAPVPGKLDVFNIMERLRDPSHVRAMSTEELESFFLQAGLAQPRVEHFRMESDLEGLLQRSFPKEGDADRIRKMFTDSLIDDALDLAARNDNGNIFYGLPVAILASTQQSAGLVR